MPFPIVAVTSYLDNIRWKMDTLYMQSVQENKNNNLSNPTVVLQSVMTFQYL